MFGSISLIFLLSYNLLTVTNKYPGLDLGNNIVMNYKQLSYISWFFAFIYRVTM